MKNVLIVDDEKAFMANLAAGLKEYSVDLFVLASNKGKQAIQILEPICLCRTFFLP